MTASPYPATPTLPRGGCGTPVGIEQHRFKGEEPCTWCGTSDVIPATAARTFAWDAGSSLWYRMA